MLEALEEVVLNQKHLTLSGALDSLVHALVENVQQQDHLDLEHLTHDLQVVELLVQVLSRRWRSSGIRKVRSLRN